MAQGCYYGSPSEFRTQSQLIQKDNLVNLKTRQNDFTKRNLDLTGDSTYGVPSENRSHY